MQVPPEISFRNIEQTEEAEKLIRDKLDKLERVCDYIISARVAVERRHRGQITGSPYEVRIAVRVPPKHELVVRRTSRVGIKPEPLPAVIRRAFDAMRVRLEELVERQRGETRGSPPADMRALVEKLFPEEGYGFLRTLDGRQVYFHRNSVLHGHFEDLIVGVEVRFTETMGEKGLQASTVEPVQKPPKL